MVLLAGMYAAIAIGLQAPLLPFAVDQPGDRRLGLSPLLCCSYGGAPQFRPLARPPLLRWRDDQADAAGVRCGGRAMRSTSRRSATSRRNPTRRCSPCTSLWLRRQGVDSRRLAWLRGPFAVVVVVAPVGLALGLAGGVEKDSRCPGQRVGVYIEMISSAAALLFACVGLRSRCNEQRAVAIGWLFLCSGGRCRWPSAWRTVRTWLLMVVEGRPGSGSRRGRLARHRSGSSSCLIAL